MCASDSGCAASPQRRAAALRPRCACAAYHALPTRAPSSPPVGGAAGGRRRAPLPRTSRAPTARRAPWGLTVARLARWAPPAHPRDPSGAPKLQPNRRHLGPGIMRMSRSLDSRIGWPVGRQDETLVTLVHKSRKSAQECTRVHKSTQERTWGEPPCPARENRRQPRPNHVSGPCRALATRSRGQNRPHHASSAPFLKRPRQVQFFDQTGAVIGSFKQ
jgi:hypothetical protein